MSPVLRRAVAVLWVVALGGILIAHVWPDRELRPTLNTALWRSYRDADPPVSLLYPPTWFVQHLDVSCSGRASGAYVVVANVSYRFEQASEPNGCTSELEMRGLPNDLAVVEISVVRAGPFGNHAEGSDTPIPLTSADLRPDPSGSTFGAPQRWYIPVNAGGWSYRVAVQAGQFPSEATMAAVDGVLRSIRFPPSPLPTSTRLPTPLPDAPPSPSP